MKTKYLSKKLGLNKRTIAHLSRNEMDTVNGGADHQTDTFCSNCMTIYDTWCLSISCLITSCFPTQTSCDTCTHECAQNVLFIRMFDT